MSEKPESYEFKIIGPMDVEEAYGDRVVLSGIFVRLDKETNNGRTYAIEEGERIANDLLSMPVFIDSTVKGEHINVIKTYVGRVVRTVFDKVNNFIRGAVEVWNTKDFPTITSIVGPGWGFSIGGQVKDMEYRGGFNSRGKPKMKAIGLMPHHMQLLPPEKPRGDDGAIVDEAEYISVEESYSFDPCPWGYCEINEAAPEVVPEVIPDVVEPVTEPPAEPMPPEKVIKVETITVIINTDGTVKTTLK